MYINTVIIKYNIIIIHILQYTAGIGGTRRTMQAVAPANLAMHLCISLKRVQTQKCLALPQGAVGRQWRARHR